MSPVLLGTNSEELEDMRLLKPVDASKGEVYRIRAALFPLKLSLQQRNCAILVPLGHSLL